MSVALLQLWWSICPLKPRKWRVVILGSSVAEQIGGVHAGKICVCTYRVIRGTTMKSSKRPLKQIAALTLGGWLAVATAAEEPRSFYFDINGQTLSQALRNYTRVSRQEILFTENVV